MRHALLALLAGGPGHGYELKQAFERQFGAIWPPVNIGQVYMTLQRLERDGLIAGQAVPQLARPNKTVYELTGAGKEELLTWFVTPAGPARLRDDSVLRILLAQTTGMADADTLLQAQRTRYLQALRDLNDIPLNGNRTTRLLVEGAALHLKAELEWLDRCEELLSGGPE